MASKYGIHSLSMLQFLWDNPGASAGEIKKHLWEQAGDPLVNVTKVITGWSSRHGHQWVQEGSDDEWWPRAWHMTGIKKQIPSSKLRRGRFSYLLSPYYSKALAGDRMGNYPHPRCQRQTGNRGWFYRENGENGRFKYYITLRGYAYLFGENPSTSAFMQTTHN